MLNSSASSLQQWQLKAAAAQSIEAPGQRWRVGRGTKIGFVS
jgi:hypothetical protein